MTCAETPGGATSASEHAPDGEPSGPAGVWTIVVGGGSGQRFGKRKQYEMLGDRRVIDWSSDVAAACSEGVVVVVPAEDAAAEDAVAGGATRSASVRAGLARVPLTAEVICVHDAARPLATPALYARVIGAVRNGADAVVPGVAVTDTIKMLGEPAASGADVMGVVVGTPDRSRLMAVQTPQAFRADGLRAAHSTEIEGTDDAAVVEAAGGTVVVVAGEADNRKITDPDDLVWSAQRLDAVRGVAQRGART